MLLVPCRILWGGSDNVHKMSCRKVFDSGRGNGREHVFDVPGRLFNVASWERRRHRLLVQ